MVHQPHPYEFTDLLQMLAEATGTTYSDPEDVCICKVNGKPCRSVKRFEKSGLCARVATHDERKKAMSSRIAVNGDESWSLSDLAKSVTEKRPRKDEESYFECGSCGNLFRTGFASSVRCNYCPTPKHFAIWIPDKVITLTNHLRCQELPVSARIVKRRTRATCPHCEKSFLKSGRSIYCSSKCSQAAAYRRRTYGDKIAA